MVIAQRKTFLKRDVQQAACFCDQAFRCLSSWAVWNLDAALSWPTPTINAEICDEVIPTLNNRFFSLLHFLLADLRLWIYRYSAFRDQVRWPYPLNGMMFLELLLEDILIITWSIYGGIYCSDVLLRQRRSCRLLLDLRKTAFFFFLKKRYYSKTQH